jgi:hypothetical protein
MTGEGDPKPAPPAQINLNDLLPPGQFDISIKPAESEADARVRRKREIVTFAVAVAMISVAFLTCLAILLLGKPSADEQRWLQSALSLILGAAAGAAFKK